MTFCSSWIRISKNSIDANYKSVLSTDGLRFDYYSTCYNEELIWIKLTCPRMIVAIRAPQFPFYYLIILAVLAALQD